MHSASIATLVLYIDINRITYICVAEHDYDKTKSRGIIYVLFIMSTIGIYMLSKKCELN